MSDDKGRAMRVRRCRAGSFAIACAASTVVTFANPAFAYLDNFLTATVLGSFSPEEATSFAAAFRATLTDVPDGQKQSWTMPARRGQPEVQATLTPVRSLTDDGQRCRLIRTQLQRGASQEQWSGWHCRQPDGDWKARSIAQSQ